MFSKIFRTATVGVVMFSSVMASEDVLQRLPMISCKQYEEPGQKAVVNFSYTPERVFESKIDTIPDTSYFTTIRDKFGEETLTDLARVYGELEEYTKYSHMAIEYSRIVPDDVRARIRIVVTITGVLYDLLNR
jgi:hypothetical protein